MAGRDAPGRFVRELPVRGKACLNCGCGEYRRVIREVRYGEGAGRKVDTDKTLRVVAHFCSNCGENPRKLRLQMQAETQVSAAPVATDSAATNLNKFIQWGEAEANGGNAFYLFWHPGVDWDEIECISPAALSQSLQGIGANCTKIDNWLLRWLGFPAVGGTTDYSNHITNWGSFDPNLEYPIGTLLNRKYYNDYDQGHNAVVITEPDSNGDQYLLQADHVGGVSADGSIGWPGVNTLRTVRETHQWAGFEWYGTIPEVGTVPLADRPPYAGFDRLEYPGDASMRWLYDNTNLFWTSFYLAPAPSQQYAGWMSKYKLLKDMGWGFAPVFLGQQTADSPDSSHVLTASQGTQDARQAALLADKAGFPRGSVVYLDIEQGAPLNTSMGAYYAAWVNQMIKGGWYYPGVYCSYQLAPALRALRSQPRFWVYHVQDACDPNNQSTYDFRPDLMSPYMTFPTKTAPGSGASLDPRDSFANARMLQWCQSIGSPCSIKTASGWLSGLDFNTAMQKDPSVATPAF